MRSVIFFSSSIKNHSIRETAAKKIEFKLLHKLYNMFPLQPFQKSVVLLDDFVLCNIHQNMR